MENNEQIIVTKEKKKSKVWLAILINILTIVLAAGGVYYYFEYIDKDEVKEVNETEETESEEQESVVINIGEIESLIEKYEYTPYLNPGVSDIYSNGTINQNIIDMSITESFRTEYTSASENNGYKATITLEEYKTALTEMYGEEVAANYVPTEINHDIVKYTYDEATETFTYVAPGGLGGTMFPWQERKVYEVIQNNNELKVSVAVGTCKTVDPNTNATECTNLDTTTPIQNTYGQFILDEHYDQLTKFEYTFKYNEDTSSYYFENITRK